MDITIGTRVVIAGGPYTGTVCALLGGEALIELDGEYEIVPTDACYRGEGSEVFWPALVSEVTPLAAPAGTTAREGSCT